MNKIIRDHKTALRSISLGTLGELLAIKALVDNGFNNIRNLNDKKTNYPYADLYAERGNEKYVISVKARNKYERSGRLNSRYNLGKNHHDHAKKAERKFKAIAAWLAIPIDDKTYSVFFGTLKSLNGNLGISMTEKNKLNYESLGSECSHNLDFTPYKNIYKTESNKRMHSTADQR
jgi:hypothetical protein